MSTVSVVFFGLSQEAAQAKGLEDAKNWNENSPPFQRIRRCLFELFRATRDGEYTLVDSGSATVNLVAFATRTSKGDKLISSIDRDSEAYKQFNPKSASTFLCEILMPQAVEGGLGDLLEQRDHPKTRDFDWSPGVKTHVLLPIFGKWHSGGEDQKDHDETNFYLPYPHKDMYGLPEDYAANLEAAAMHNFHAMKAVKVHGPVVGGKLGDQYNELFGCGYCKQQQTQFGCGYCKSGGGGQKA